MTKIIKTDKTARRLRIFFHKTTECADYAEFLVVLLKKMWAKRISLEFYLEKTPILLSFFAG